MATSSAKAFTRFAASRLDSDSPIDTAQVKDALIDSALHLYDESAQHLVNFVPPTAALRISLDLAVTNTYKRLTSFGPFAVHLRRDGSPYPFVLRFAGALSAALGTGTFLIELKRVGDAYRDGAASWSVTATTTVTTDAWLTLSASNPFTIDRSFPVDDTTITLPCAEYLGGPGGASYANEYRVDVHAKVTNASADAICSGLLLRQYIGL